MDQSLELLIRLFELHFAKSFNPYFSGSVTGTPIPDNLLSIFLVSILILVDQSLEPIFNLFNIIYHSCFNPYFSGSVTGTKLIIIHLSSIFCFNPYFSGSVTGTKY